MRRASVLECACPLALWEAFRSSVAIQSGTGLPHSPTWRQIVRFVGSPHLPLHANWDQEPGLCPQVLPAVRFAPLPKRQRTAALRNKGATSPLP